MAFSILFSMGCNTSQRVPESSQIKVSDPWVFRYDFQKAVYKTDMRIYGNELSGITIIKKTSNNYRIVSMSEVGLKYFDIEFFGDGNEVNVHYMINFLDRKPVIEMLTNNFRSVFMTFPEKRKEKYYKDSMTKSMVKEIKYQGHKSRYVYDQNFGMVKTIHDKKKGTNLVISLQIKDNPSPETMNFNQNNLNMRFERIE
jgi:hypothetical protein